MQQDEIFKLLLIILLLCNEKSNCSDGTGYSSLNEIIIICLLMNTGRNDCCNNNNMNALTGPATTETTF